MGKYFSKNASGDSEFDVWMKEVEAALDAVTPVDVPGIITYDRTAKGVKANIVQKPGAAAPITYHPFKVYKSPPNPDDDPDDSALWRTFRVRAGALGTVPVLNTDGADESPDNPASPVTNRAYDADIDIIVPDATAAFYIWIDATDETSPFIDSGVTIPGGGTDDDWWGGIYYLVCIIDTNTYTATKRAIPRQFIRDDIPKCA